MARAGRMLPASVPSCRIPSPSQWYNPAAFVNRLNFVTGVGPYTIGNDGRNNVVGPPLTDLDASMFKSFFFTERIRAGLPGGDVQPSRTTRFSASPPQPWVSPVKARLLRRAFLRGRYS